MGHMVAMIFGTPPIFFHRTQHLPEFRFGGTSPKWSSTWRDVSTVECPHSACMFPLQHQLVLLRLGDLFVKLLIERL
ncbi:MAG: hypothetical protein M2R45_03260 [Verrucomicrobia subdivision 3 bacterium]|nr:hypothetical protein [Limisphaerales bacterium]MCS1416121.1 hypothetical protein [Limisphaerales bacterium]